MKLNKRTLAAVAATGVASGALAFGGVALATTSSTATPATATAALAATPAATPAVTPTSAAGWCGGGPGGTGLSGYGLLAGQQVMKATAAYLGLSQDQLLSQLQSGKSLAAVATAQHKPVSGLKTAILAAATSQVNASTRLSAAQKADMISELKSHLDAIVNATHPAGFGPHGMGGPGRGAGWMPGA
jgi:hypothetical protein